MSMTTSAITTPAQSTTGTLKRTVSDDIRHLYPGNLLFALISSGMLTGVDTVAKQKGLIGKRKVNTPKYEAFTVDPATIEFTVSSVTSATEFVVSSADGLTLKMCLLNTRNRTVCRIAAISSTTLTVVSVGDATGTFSCAAEDTLLAMAPAYEENSSSPYVLMTEPTNLYNYTQISRFAVEFSNTAKGNPHYGGDYWQGIRKRSAYDGLRKVEIGALFMDRASSTNQTTADATLGAFRSTRGLVQWAGTSWGAGGSMTADRWLTTLSEQFDETVGAENGLVALCGTAFYGRMLQWVADKMIVDLGKDSSLEMLGVKCNRFMTAKQPNGIKVMVHDAFDRGSLANQMFIFDPDLAEYVYLRDRDFKPQNGIQNNDVDGVKDEILGEWGMHFIDGGQHAMLVTDLY